MKRTTDVFLLTEEMGGRECEISGRSWNYFDMTVREQIVCRHQMSGISDRAVSEGIGPPVGCLPAEILQKGSWNQVFVDLPVDAVRKSQDPRRITQRSQFFRRGGKGSRGVPMPRFSPDGGIIHVHLIRIGDVFGALSFTADMA